MNNPKHPFLMIHTKKGSSYGGNQSWLKKRYLKNYGCGIIGAADIILCVQGQKEISEKEYLAFAHGLWKRYLPVLPGFGMNGITLQMGMNRYFKKKKLPFRARWKISGKKLFSRIDQMLAENLPVILSVGPNFPKFWKKETLCLYVQKGNQVYVPSCRVCAHYVTVTNRVGEWIEISSWGERYFIKQKEYEEYVKKYSNYIVSNIICIQRIKRIK